MRDYRKEQFISRFKNSNINRTEAERKYKLKVEEEEELERRRIFEAMNSRAVQEALQAGGASAAVGGSTESYQLVGENILVYFRSQTTSTYQVLAFNYADNKISGPTDLGIESSASINDSHIITGKGSLVYGEGPVESYIWYAFLDINGAIIEQDTVYTNEGWGTNDPEGNAVAIYYIQNDTAHVKWWTGNSSSINSCEIPDCNGSLNMGNTSHDDSMEDGTINGMDGNLNRWSFLPNGEFYNITEAINSGGERVERYATYSHGNFYAILYSNPGEDYYTALRFLTNKGVILQTMDLTASYNFTEYSTGFYGDNKFYIDLHSESDLDVPHYYVVYNGNTDTIITKEDPRGINFNGDTRYSIEYEGGYQKSAERLTNGDVIVFSPDDGSDLGFDGKFNRYHYIKFHALIGNSNEFVTYEHANDGEEEFKYRADLSYAGNPAFIVKQEDSNFVKIMTLKQTGADFHLTDINYSDARDGDLEIHEIGDNIWIQSFNNDTNERNFRTYTKEGVLIDSLNLSGSLDWNRSGSSVWIIDHSNDQTYYSTDGNFNMLDADYFNSNDIDSCVHSEDGSYYSNIFAYGEGYLESTPGIIISKNGVSPEITLADSRYGDWSGRITPNYAIWLAKNIGGTYTISVYSLNGTLLLHTDLGVESYNNFNTVGDRVYFTSYVGDHFRTWMIKGSQIQYVDAITEAEANDYTLEYNDWVYDDCD